MFKFLKKIFGLTGAAGSAEPPSSATRLPATKEADKKKRHGRGATVHCREMNLEALPYVPLPHAPHKWEGVRRSRAPKKQEDATDWFEIREGEGWTLKSIDKVPMEDRPDTAFRVIHPINTGLLMFDDLGKSELSSEASAAALFFGRDGTLQSSSPLAHDLYRLGVNALGMGFIAMSRECVAHAYNDSLQPIFETPIPQFSELMALQERLGIAPQSLKNHLRCVALTHDNSRYLWTGVDEAWCFEVGGKVLWGLRMPLQESWTRISEPSSSFGTSAEIMQAMTKLNLSLPFSPEDVKKNYRELAKKWHPDLNPGIPEAQHRMTEINAAAELLTGIDQVSLPNFTGGMARMDLGRHEVNVGGMNISLSMGMMMSEKSAADWIYAAAFSGQNKDVYLAGYSGKIVQVMENGEPQRVYDIGAVPRQIVDTGDYLYFLTDTRLYVIQGDSLVTLMDTVEKGSLIVAQTGFGFLEKNQFTWFREDGAKLGVVATKNPIRRVYYSPEGMVVETRQRRALVQGVSTWWE